MTYAYYGNFNGVTRHHSPLYASDNLNIDFSVKHWIQKGAHPRKLILGIPSFGHSFTLTDPENHGLNASTSGPGVAGGWTKIPGTLAFYEICYETKCNEWTVVRDPENKIGPYAHKDDRWVSFDDVDNVRTKAKYIRNMNLGGGMIWALDLDDFTNYCGCGNYPLLTALNQEIRQIGGKPLHNCA